MSKSHFMKLPFPFLHHFQRLVGKCNSRQITQGNIDKFILDRGKEVKRTTLNKDIRNLKAFFNWCREKRYVNGDIKLKLLKEDERPVKSLTNPQVKKLLSASKPYPTMRMRILLALGTGLRRNDIELLSISDIDFKTVMSLQKAQRPERVWAHDLCQFLS